MKELAVCLFIVFAVGVLSCSGDSEKAEFDCDKLCDKTLECGNIKESQLANCKSYCKDYQNNGYFEQSYMDAMGKCLTEDKCNDIESCVNEIPSQCPPPPDVSKYAETLCDKMIECKATLDTKEACVGKVGKPENYKCLTQKFIDNTTTCIAKIKCETYLTDFLNCQAELLK
ncbi:MAG: hypothetical protein N3B13_00550 [Deltaproteobacteria bacterium]|nr:hypothetical protein [Deltaproteobacteria bacterium]